jgi:hypothetical protein
MAANKEAADVTGLPLMTEALDDVAKGILMD